jgi:7-cyano-7-deazaguanine reductase
MLLGQHTPVVREYAPHLLYPIPRAEARQQLGLAQPMPFFGEDVWYAYELSWLDDSGKPVVRVGRFTVPASSPSLVESKSFKLYLNSLNSTRFSSDEAVHEVIVRDLSETAGGSVTLELLTVDDPSIAGTRLSGLCLDDLPVVVGNTPPAREMLERDTSRVVEETLYSHLMRSLCPVTGQPDWASVWLHYRGNAIEHRSLLQYIIAYREHQEFHEQCVERMFIDIQQRCEPESLTIQAFYTRRGGLDINPFRSTVETARPHSRLNRQ